MRHKTFARAVWVAVFAGAIGIVPLSSAEEPEPTSAPEKPKTETSRPKTLADLAGGIKLQDPNAQQAGGVVIDNANLKEMGEGAVISEGKELGGGARSRTQASGRGGDQQGPTGAELDKARQDVELLQAQLKAIDQATEENKAVNLYQGMGPQYRAPGQTDPLQTQRQDLEKRLETAQGAYTALEKQQAAAARKSGSGQGSQPIPPPTKRKPITR